MGLCEVLMGRFVLSESVLPLVAERFKALSEPARLSLLGALQQGEQTVNQLVSGTGLGQANASKHLQVLHAVGVRLDVTVEHRAVGAEGLHSGDPPLPSVCMRGRCSSNLSEPPDAAKQRADSYIKQDCESIEAMAPEKPGIPAA